MAADKPVRPVLVAGGGTAGHLVPGLAIGRALVALGWPQTAVQFVGSRRGIEREMVPAAGFDLTTLAGRGLNERRLSLANLANLAAIVVGVLTGVWLVLRRRPAAVVSLGGYAALPASIGAVLTRVPLIISEQNAVPSATNRLLSRFAKAAAVPFEGVELRRAVVTGNPVREEVVAAAEVGASRDWPPDRCRVVVFGGSLGSLRINTAVWEQVEELTADGDMFVYHVVGHRDWPTRPSLDLGRDRYVCVEYDNDLASALATADVVVARAGGSTVAELAAIGVASVLVPLPIATNDHQRHNAAALAAVGAARVVDDVDFDGARLVAELAHYRTVGVTDAAAAARTVGKPDAANQVAQLVIDAARSVPPGIDRRHT